MSHAETARQYVDDVLAGRIAACKWVRLACKRQRDDLKRKRWRYRFDESKANAVCDFIEALPHVKGRYGAAIKLQPWQVFILTTVFGWVTAEGFRRFRTAYLELPRKQGKSTISSGVGLYMLAADGEPGAEVYSAATTRDQAKIVFGDAHKMVKRTAALRDGLGVEASAHAIYQAESGSTFKALSRDQDGNLDGLNVHCALIDELHGHKDRGVWDVIETATGARKQSLLWAITTAGSNRAGICYEQRGYVCKVLNKVHADETYFGIIFTIDSEPYEIIRKDADALAHLLETSQWRNASTATIESWWREACARAATSGSAGRTARAVATILSVQSKRADSAPRVTAQSSRRSGQAGGPSEPQSRLIGDDGIPRTYGSPATSGARNPATRSSRSTSAECLSTESVESDTTPSLKAKGGDAESAERKAQTFAWITATALELFGESSAKNAMRQSAFSEILRKVYELHCDTYGARGISLDGSRVTTKVGADDPFDPASWAKANPNYGVSVEPDDLARKASKARQMVAAQNNFLTKHLNVWVNADTAWMTMGAWDKCADPKLLVEDFAGQECVVGNDLATKTDIAASVKLFWREIEGKRHYYAFGRYYLPEEAAEDGRSAHYAGWATEGRMRLTDGNVTDFSVIEDDLREDARTFNVLDATFDPWQAAHIIQRLEGEGMTVTEYRQTVQNMSGPMKELEALVLQGRFHHDGCPVLTWMVSNVVCHVDAKENIYPRKERPENKIDGVVALIMALGRAMLPAESGSMEQGFVVIA